MEQGEGNVGQGEDHMDTMGVGSPKEQSKNKKSKPGANVCLELESVSKALGEIELKSSPKRTGLPGRKYSTVVLASPKKRLLLNRLYGAKKSTGKNSKNKIAKTTLPHDNAKFLVNRGLNVPGNNMADKGGKQDRGSDSGKRGPMGGGIPLHSSKK
ncbi:unnamed protein product [Cochlearia groenlandica]